VLPVIFFVMLRYTAGKQVLRWTPLELLGGHIIWRNMKMQFCIYLVGFCHERPNTYLISSVYLPYSRLLCGGRTHLKE
jgi:hypothetical protein